MLLGLRRHRARHRRGRRGGLGRARRDDAARRSTRASRSTSAPPRAVYAADGTRLGFIPAASCARRSPRSDDPADHPTDATVAIEDRRFFKHKGVDFEGILRAAVKNLETADDIQGGSTLTMQLVRNLYTGERRARATLQAQDPRGQARRGPREPPPRPPGQDLDPRRSTSTACRTARSAARPRSASRPASRMFFDKPASKLTLRQAALLAGLPQAPSALQPVPATRSAPKRAATRSCRRWPTRATSARRPAQATMRRGLGVKRNRYFTERREGYFFDYVKSELIDRYGARRGPQGRPARRHDDRPAPPAPGARDMDGQLGAPDRAAAIVTIDPRTGYIKAMASSSRYGDSKFNLAAQGHRQAGLDVQGHGPHDGDPARGEPGVDDLRVAPAAGRLAADGADLHRQDVRATTTRARMNLVRATLRSDNSVYAQLDADVGPEQVTQDGPDDGHHEPAPQLPGRGPGRPHRRRLAARDGATRTRRSPRAATATTSRRSARSRSPTATSSASASRRRSASSPTARPTRRRRSSSRTSRPAPGSRTPPRSAAPPPARPARSTTTSTPGSSASRPRLATAVWLGHAKSRIPMPGITGGTIPAHIWGQYMKVARGVLLRGVRPADDAVRGPALLRQVRRRPRRSRARRRPRTRPRRRPARRPARAGRPPTARPRHATGTGTGTPDTPTDDGGGAANGKYPPDQYESPPQAAPGGGAKAPG